MSLCSMTGCGGIGNNNVASSSTVNKYASAVDYSKLDYKVNVTEKTNIADYLVGFDEFCEIMKQNRIDELTKLKPIIGKSDNDKNMQVDIYQNMIDGLDSEYFRAYCESEYQRLYVNISNMLSQMPYINAEWEKYSDTDIKLLDKCVVPDCDVIDYYEKYVTGDILDMLVDAHLKYESMIQYEANLISEPDKDYKEMFYLEKICTNTDYIDNIELDLKFTDNDDKLYGTKTVKVKNGEFTDELKKAIEGLDLYRSYDFYDGEFAHIASNAVNSLCVEYDKDMQIKYIKDLEFDYSLCDQLDANDLFKLNLKIKNIKHKDDIPAQDKFEDELNEKSKIMEAQVLIYDNIMQSINDSVATQSEVETVE